MRSHHTRVKQGAPICAKLKVPRQLSSRYHVGRFLQLDVLLVDEGALVVNNDVGVKRAFLWLSINRSAASRSSSAPSTSHSAVDTHEAQVRGSLKPLNPPCTSM